MGYWLVKKLVQTRNVFSRLVNSHRANTTWRPILTSLERFEQWMLTYFVYKHDFLGGLVDNTKSVGHMFWQHRSHEGVIKGDCDDSATLYVWALKEFRRDVQKSITGIWRVNIPKYRHVICVWAFMQDDEAQFCYSSGRSIYYRTTFASNNYGWGSIREVVDAYGSRTRKSKLGVVYYAEPVSRIDLS